MAETKKNLAKALSAFQSQAISVPKNGKGNWGKYARLEDILPKVLPELSKNGLSVMQLMSHIGSEPALKTIIAHESGETFEAITPMILDKQNPQGHGGAVTYYRRYALGSALGLITDEDDDGQAMSDSIDSKPYKSNPKGNPNRPATDKQKKLVFDLLVDKNNILPDDVVSFIDSEFNVDASKMTGYHANEIISALLGTEGG